MCFFSGVPTSHVSTLKGTPNCQAPTVQLTCLWAIAAVGGSVGSQYSLMEAN